MDDVDNRQLFVVVLGLASTSVPYGIAFYYNNQLCEREPTTCAAVEQKYERQNFDFNAAFDQGVTKLEQLVQTYSQ